jgi:hypothetical protein
LSLARCFHETSVTEKKLTKGKITSVTENVFSTFWRNSFSSSRSRLPLTETSRKLNISQFYQIPPVEIQLWLTSDTGIFTRERMKESGYWRILDGWMTLYTPSVCILYRIFSMFIISYPFHRVMNLVSRIFSNAIAFCMNHVCPRFINNSVYNPYERITERSTNWQDYVCSVPTKSATTLWNALYQFEKISTIKVNKLFWHAVSIMFVFSKDRLKLSKANRVPSAVV